MIIRTTKEVKGVVYAYAYSDSGSMIERDGVRYSEAVDPLESGRLYTETDEPIDVGTSGRQVWLSRPGTGSTIPTQTGSTRW